MSPTFILGHEIMHPYLILKGMPYGTQSFHDEQEKAIINDYEKNYSTIYGGYHRTGHKVKIIQIHKTENLIRSPR